MFVDALYDFIGLSGAVWIGVAMAYALFDYGFNTIMCWFTGGAQRIRLPARDSVRTGSTLRDGLVLLRLAIHQFRMGGDQRRQEFRSDSLSWIWPITVLAIPTALFGVTRTVVKSVVADLIEAGVLIINYRILPFSWLGDRVQYLTWLISLLVAFITLWRYRRRRLTQTWFSRSIVFHVLRIVLFDTPLVYMIMNVALLWFDFAASLYRVLLDHSIAYTILHPDLMYGLQSAHKAVVGISLSLVLVSLLPTIMLLREKQETYSWIYYVVLYSSVLITFVLGGILIYQFDQRLEAIQQATLQVVLERVDLGTDAVTGGGNPTQMTAGLQYYMLVSRLPGGFPVPSWFKYVFGVRILVLGYELYVILSSVTEQASLSEAVWRFIQKALQ